jgi:TolB-like protein
MVLPLVLAAVLAAGPAASPPPKRQKMAVMDLKAVQGVSQGTAEILGNVIAADMAKQGFDVIAKSDIQAMLGFQKDRALLGCTEDASCIAEIGGSLGVDYVLTGQVGKIGSQFNISLLVVDSRKARVVTRLSSFCDANEDALVRAAREGTGTLTMAIRGGPEPEAPSRPFTRSPRTAYAAWGVGAALVVGGALAGLSARGQYSDLEKLKSAPNYIDLYADKKPGIQRMNLTADLLFAGGAVAAGLGTWVWFRVERAPVTIAPVAVSDGAGVVVAGAF